MSRLFAVLVAAIVALNTVDAFTGDLFVISLLTLGCQHFTFDCMF
jgi:hypothetical protein